ncbi:type II toxin-antitoxin system RelE family toxin [Consotaella aegiceratis]|uniref:type II toxin-antitoxin system RelE family toxin n=1 Tax=Consotaella aegiceratis TaxID=3097961 RepID=UPI002F3F70BA
MGMKAVQYQKQALKVLRRMPRNTAQTIRQKIEQYAEDPKSLRNNVKLLAGRPGKRLRVGDWRVIFDEDDCVIDIREVGPRGSIYE